MMELRELVEHMEVAKLMVEKKVESMEQCEQRSTVEYAGVEPA